MWYASYASGWNRMFHGRYVPRLVGPLWLMEFRRRAVGIKWNFIIFFFDFFFLQISIWNELPTNRTPEGPAETRATCFDSSHSGTAAAAGCTHTHNTVCGTIRTASVKFVSLHGSHRHVFSKIIAKRATFKIVGRSFRYFFRPPACEKPTCTMYTQHNIVYRRRSRLLTV